MDIIIENTHPVLLERVDRGEMVEFEDGSRGLMIEKSISTSTDPSEPYCVVFIVGEGEHFIPGTRRASTKVRRLLIKEIICQPLR